MEQSAPHFFLALRFFEIPYIFDHIAKIILFNSSKFFIFKGIKKRVFKHLKNPFDIEKIYNNHLVRKSEIRKKELDKLRPTGKSYYRVSSSGMCARKLYYETILRLETSDKIDDKTRRIFRLGDLIHEDLQDALLQHKRKEAKENNI